MGLEHFPHPTPSSSQPKSPPQLQPPSQSQTPSWHQPWGLQLSGYLKQKEGRGRERKKRKVTSSNSMAIRVRQNTTKTKLKRHLIYVLLTKLVLNLYLCYVFLQKAITEGIGFRQWTLGIIRRRYKTCRTTILVIDQYGIISHLCIFLPAGPSSWTVLPCLLSVTHHLHLDIIFSSVRPTRCHPFLSSPAFPRRSLSAFSPAVLICTSFL